MDGSHEVLSRSLQEVKNIRFSYVNFSFLFMEDTSFVNYGVYMKYIFGYENSIMRLNTVALMLCTVTGLRVTESQMSKLKEE